MCNLYLVVLTFFTELCLYLNFEIISHRIEEKKHNCKIYACNCEKRTDFSDLKNYPFYFLMSETKKQLQANKIQRKKSILIYKFRIARKSQFSVAIQTFFLWIASSLAILSFLCANVVFLRIKIIVRYTLKI